MKNEYILLGAILLSAQVQGQWENNKVLKSELVIANQTVSKLTNMAIVRNQYIYRYKSPIETVLKFTSPFGYRELNVPWSGGTRKSEHMGVDLKGDWHCAIHPVAQNGEVIDVWQPPNGYYHGHPEFGGYVRIRHDDDYISGYAHLSSVYVKEHDKLIDGKFYRNGNLISSEDVLGRQGNTGQSTGEHLHLSIMNPEGEFVDPLLYIDTDAWR
jgi:murein DD-endopeptidase MepM/ murein hydrolase activator NlpD